MGNVFPSQVGTQVQGKQHDKHIGKYLSAVSEQATAVKILFIQRREIAKLQLLCLKKKTCHY